ncbi:MAG TPA: amidohydrolase family protein [Aggregatilineales bacterium]|nr:amidohydrolase family protein [Aggregatilineales bacterium]
MNRPLHIRGAQVWDSHEVTKRDLYIDRGRFVAEPPSGAQVIDLDGYTLFPGLINAHDHLELNHYPRSKFRERYDNAHQWGEDMNVRLNDEPYKSLRAYPLEDRCFIGGLKNLLCGATTVVHHNPPHKCLFKSDFPVRVLKEYGWAHSLHFDTDEEIVRSYRSTPKEWPWFIHLAEGTDEVAAGEYQRLKALGCVGKNTVIVHGVGMTDEDITDAAPLVRGLVWCPTTNAYLLSTDERADLRKPYIRLWRSLGANVALGSDSRLTALGDFLREMRYGRMKCGCDVDCIVQAAVRRASLIIGQPRIGNLQTNSFADWTLTPSIHGRSKISLVVTGGIPRIGDPEVMAKFPHIETVGAILDGVPKAIHIDLARRIHRCSLKEPGLEVEPLPKRGFFFT